MVLRPLILFLVLVFWANTPAFAAPASSSDARLDKRVHLELEKTTLGRAVDALARAAGARLTVARDVADEPVLLFAHDQPARTIMDQLAELLDYTWRRTGTAEQPGYELFQSQRAARAEAALRKQDEDEAIVRLRAALRRRVDLASLDPQGLLETAERLEARQDPRLPPASVHQEMAGPLWRALARFAAGLDSGQWQALMEDKSLYFSTKPTPGCQKMTAAVESSLREAVPTMFPPGSRPNFAEPDDAEAFARLDQKTRDQWASAAGYRLRVRLERSDDEAILNVRPSTLLPDNFEGVQRMNAPGLVVSSEEVARSAVLLEPAGPADADRNPFWQGTAGFEVKPLPHDPSRPNRPTTDSANRILARIARAYRLNLIADAYRHIPFNLPALKPMDSLTLAEAMRRYVSPIGIWRKNSDFVRARRRYWYRDRMAELPIPWLERWSTTLRKTGQLTVEDVGTTCVQLRDAQIENLEAALHDRGVDLGTTTQFELVRKVKIFRMYGLLTAPQREHLRRGGGLLYGEMPAPARQWLERALSEHQRDSEDPPPLASAPPARLSTPRLIRRGSGFCFAPDPALRSGETNHSIIGYGGDTELEKLLRKRNDPVAVVFRFEQGSGFLYWSFVIPPVGIVPMDDRGSVTAPPAK